jgi:hypothetical protein
MKNLLLFWEDQHPLARNNILILVVSIVIWISLLVLTYFVPRNFAIEQVFEIAVTQRIWEITILVLMALMAYNAVRLTYRYATKLASFASVAMAWTSIAIMLLIAANSPSFHHSTISYLTGDSYGTVLTEFKDLCDGWEATYGQQSTVALNPDDLDLGYFQNREEVDVMRIQRAVFFNFGTNQQRFGLACVLGGGSYPDSGRAENFKYDKIEKNYYEFIERDDR